MKINAPAPVAHDLVIWGGFIRCYEHPEGAHQDGIQALGGERITLRNLEINCNSGANAQLFLNGANGGMPTDIACEKCFLGTGAATTLRVSESVRSGARNSTICPGRFRDINTAGSVEPPCFPSTAPAVADTTRSHEIMARSTVAEGGVRASKGLSSGRVNREHLHTARRRHTWLLLL